MLTDDRACEIIDTYIQAWETQDPDRIVTIFTKDATYHERVLSDPIPNRDAIRDYWATKVVSEQANIKVEVIKLIIDNDLETVCADWLAEFDDLVKGERKRMREFAILEFRDGLVFALREVWASESLGALEPS